MTDLKKVLSFNMKQNRKKLKLSQANLAELINVSENHIALMETGRRFPSLSMLIMLAQAFKIDVLELFSVKAIQLKEKKRIKEAILSDIDQILSARLLDGE